MKYILKHKEYKVYYCFDKKDKRKFFKVDSERAYRFDYKCDAARIRKYLKHPDEWDIVEVINE